MTDWDLIKTQYEILGKDVKELCDAHHVTSGILESAIDHGNWVAPNSAIKAVGTIGQSAPTTPTTTPEPAEQSELEKLNEEAALLQARHQHTLIPKYIEIETTFLSRLKTKAGNFMEASEAKMIADTLAVIKPAVMKQADAKNAKGAEAGLFGSGGRIMVVNQFPVPQPGDDHYIAPNAVLIGENAGQDVGADYTTIEIPETGDMN